MSLQTHLQSEASSIEMVSYTGSRASYQGYHRHWFLSAFINNKIMWLDLGRDPCVIRTMHLIS